MAILVLGDGLLAKEIVKQTQWNYVSRKKDGIDFNDIDSYSLFIRPNDTVVNCIGSTNTYSKEREEHWNTNFVALIDLVEYCNLFNNKIVHISTDYIYAHSVSNARETDVPVHARNWYSYTKLLGDAYIQATCRDYLLVRTSFKPTPFPYEKAIITQRGNFDYVDVIAGIIIELIRGKASGVYNVGTEEKTIYDLAMKTKYVKRMNRLLDPTMPVDITMNTEKLERFLKNEEKN